MSKVADTKKKQGWRKKGPVCGNCVHYSSKMVTIARGYGTWEEEKMKRCTLGGFAVGKSNWCESHEFKED